MDQNFEGWDMTSGSDETFPNETYILVLKIMAGRESLTILTVTAEKLR